MSKIKFNKCTYMNQNMKLSVVMSCYNSSRFLRESIESILNQTYSDFEFIIWNDGSTDDTEQIIKSYDDERILYSCAPNQGAGIARAEACKKARGKYIAIMDSDDIAYPWRFEKEIAFLDSHQDFIVVSSLVDYIDEEGGIFGQSIQPCTDEALKMRCNIVNPASMFRKDAYLKAGGFLDIRTGQDIVLWGRMARFGKFANIPEPLIKYRVQRNSIGRKLRQENYNACLVQLRKKIIEDEVVDSRDIELLNTIWKQNVETSKKLPPFVIHSVIDNKQQRILDFGSIFIGKKNMLKMMCVLKGILIKKHIL